MVNEKKNPKKEKEVAEGLEGMGKMDKGSSGMKSDSTRPDEAKGSEVENLKKELEKERGRAKSLEKERGELEGKSRSLAKIIEKFSSESQSSEPPEPVEPKLKDMEKKLTDQFQAQLKELKESVESVGTKMVKTEKPEDGRVKKLVDKIQGETTSKIAALEDTIKRLSERLTPTETPGKGGEDVSKGLSAIGGNVELQSDLEEVKRSLKDLERTFSEMRDENETRFTRIKEQMKHMEKLPSLEERVQALIEKLGPENIEKLKKLVFSTEELSNQVIPQEISKKLSKELSPVLSDVKSFKDEAGKLNERIKRVYTEVSYFKGELKTLYKFGDYISGLQSDRDKTRQDVKEREGRLLEKMASLETKLKEKSQEISENIKNFKKDYSDFVEEFVRKLFMEIAESKLSEVKDKTSKELVAFRDEMNVISSRFYQFENEIIPKMEMIKEQMDKSEKVLGRLKDFQEKLNLNVEKSIEKKFAVVSKPALNEMENRMSKTFETVDERVEGLESELSQFRDVVNPTLEMFKGDLGKFDGRLDKLNEFQSDLSEKVKEIKGENREVFKTLGSLEKLEENIETLDEKSKEIDDLKGMLDKSIKDLDNKMKTLDERLGAQKKVLDRIDQIERWLEDSSVERGKLRDNLLVLEKRTEDGKNLFEEGVDELRNDISQLENVVKPSLDMFKNNLDEFSDDLQAFKESQGRLKEEMKELRVSDKDMLKSLDMLESYVQNISQLQKGFEYLEGSRKSFVNKFEKTGEKIKTLAERVSSARKSIEGFEEKWKDLKTIGSFQEKMEKRISRLEKELANTRAQFENVVEQSLMDRKKLEETSRKQKERINSLLGELRG